MKKEFEKFGIIAEEISDENIDFHKMQSESEDDDNLLETVEDPKIQENLSTVNSDDSVRIYLQQIGKIPLLSSEQELDLAKKIKEVTHTDVTKIKEDSRNKRFRRKARKKWELDYPV